MVMTCFVQYAPYHLAEGSWNERREALGDAVIDALADHIPNIREIIIGRQVMTPLDIERTAGITEGNIFQEPAEVAVLPEGMVVSRAVVQTWEVMTVTQKTGYGFLYRAAYGVFILC